MRERERENERERERVRKRERESVGLTKTKCFTLMNALYKCFYKLNSLKLFVVAAENFFFH